MKQLILALFLCFSLNAYSQCEYQSRVPKEYYRDRYQPVNAWLERPYAMFNKRKPGWTLQSELEKIRTMIIDGQPNKGHLEFNFKNKYAWIYYEIYQYAILPEPSKCGRDETGCAHPIWVKSNAIVHLILGPNRPNPFDHTTLIDYELVPGYRTARIEITNTLGQTVQTIIIHNNRGTIQLDGSRLQSGVYYYALVVDDSRESSRIMVVK